MKDKTFKYAKMERERRFLLAELPPGVDPDDYLLFEDLYIADSGLRLRRATDPSGKVVEMKLGQKRIPTPPLPSHRITTSLYLDAAEYALLDRLDGRRLEKRRHAFPWKGVEYGVAVFLGPLAGLILAEAEADSDGALAALPELSGAPLEVTDDPLFRGGAPVNEPPEHILDHARRLLGT